MVSQKGNKKVGEALSTYGENVTHSTKKLPVNFRSLLCSVFLACIRRLLKTSAEPILRPLTKPPVQKATVLGFDTFLHNQCDTQLHHISAQPLWYTTATHFCTTTDTQLHMSFCLSTSALVLVKKSFQQLHLLFFLLTSHTLFKGPKKKGWVQTLSFASTRNAEPDWNLAQLKLHFPLEEL